MKVTERARPVIERVKRPVRLFTPLREWLPITYPRFVRPYERESAKEEGEGEEMVDGV